MYENGLDIPPSNKQIHIKSVRCISILVYV